MANALIRNPDPIGPPSPYDTGVSPDSVGPVWSSGPERPYGMGSPTILQALLQRIRDAMNASVGLSDPYYYAKNYGGTPRATAGPTSYTGPPIVGPLAPRSDRRDQDNENLMVHRGRLQPLAPIHDRRDQNNGE